MTELGWLVGHRFQSLKRREFDWVLVFEQDVSLVLACLWRLAEADRIRFTSQDDGHQFGLPAPVDVVAEVNCRLAGASVEAAKLRKGFLDVELRFSTGHVLQIIPDSAGYEAWHLCKGRKEYIAVGGGDLVIFGGDLGSG